VLASIRQLRSSQAGFTLAELNMSILLISIITLSILGIFTNFLVTTTRNNVSLDMAVDSQSLLRSAAEELRYGGGVRQTNTITDANAPTGGWNTSNTTFVIIVAIPALDASDEYIINPDTGYPYLNELVYYKQGSTLMKRALAHPSATGNTLKTSCPAVSANASCPADRKLAENVSAMVFTLYDQDDAITTNALLARSVKINLTMSRDTFGAPLVMENSIRTTLRNTLQ
jgi:type II secretory pathway pseudopilin PulG